MLFFATMLCFCCSVIFALQEDHDTCYFLAIILYKCCSVNFVLQEDHGSLCCCRVVLQWKLITESSLCTFGFLSSPLARSVCFETGHGLQSPSCMHYRYMSLDFSSCILFVYKCHRQKRDSGWSCVCSISSLLWWISCTRPQCIPCPFVFLTCTRGIVVCRGRSLARNLSFESLRDGQSRRIDCRYTFGVVLGMCSITLFLLSS